MAELFLGIDLGGTNIKTGVVDAEGQNIGACECANGEGGKGCECANMLMGARESGSRRRGRNWGRLWRWRVGFSGAAGYGEGDCDQGTEY